MADTFRLYSDLSWLWPAWGGVEEYRAESELVAELARRHAKVPVRTLLDVGCGGGKNLHHFARHFEATGLDLSPTMLDLARTLNADVELVQADMRSFDLGRRFDAVYLNDALPHLQTREDLGRAFACAHRHVVAGGVVLAVAEFTRERFEPNATSVTPAVGGACPTGVDVVFVENQYDPDPGDDTFENTILYLIREQGRLRIERDTWELGLFGLADWVRLATAAGLEVHVEEGHEALERLPLLVCLRP